MHLGCVRVIDVVMFSASNEVAPIEIPGFEVSVPRRGFVFAPAVQYSEVLEKQTIAAFQAEAVLVSWVIQTVREEAVGMIEPGDLVEGKLPIVVLGGVVDGFNLSRAIEDQDGSRVSEQVTRLLVVLPESYRSLSKHLKLIGVVLAKVTGRSEPIHQDAVPARC